jgi:hypothetical protein
VKKAKKLLEALSNREFTGLTKARASALSDFISDLGYEIDMDEVFKEQERTKQW